MQFGDLRSVGGRDLRIDWLRGLAMTCVIINHSKLSSLLSWFSYERLWVVTAAEVFVILSGIVLGMVYRRRLDRHGWAAVVQGLVRRAIFLYSTFIAVTVSILVLAASGVDVHAVSPSAGHAPWFFAPQTMDAAAWRDVLLMRSGPWPFEIIGLYVWLVAAAVPCFVILQRAGWRSLLGASWALYLWYRLAPHAVTAAGFESAFPLLAWQLLFVHGIVIGYHRDQITAAAERIPPRLAAAAVVSLFAFTVFALCNPWTDGPSWLRLRLLSGDRFGYVYGHFFLLKELGAARLANLAVGLSVAYGALTRWWSLVRPLHALFITLGQQSLGAFVLHVYAVLLLAYLPVPAGPLVNTLVQVAIVVGIAAALNAVQRLRTQQRATPPMPAQAIAA
jgi:hypothetical protein